MFGAVNIKYFFLKGSFTLMHEAEHVCEYGLTFRRRNYFFF